MASFNLSKALHHPYPLILRQKSSIIKASISIAIKLGLDTPFELISVFRKALEMFVKKRPR
jgi:hypothetical protein